jgi:hypothetical protein
MPITKEQFEKLSEFIAFLPDEREFVGDELTEDQMNVVKSNPQAAFWYAKNVVGGEWKDGENAIRVDPRSSYYYALVCVRKPWQPGEFAINSNIQFKLRYSRWCKRFK